MTIINNQMKTSYIRKLYSTETQTSLLKLYYYVSACIICLSATYMYEHLIIIIILMTYKK